MVSPAVESAMTQKHARDPCHVPNTATLGDRYLFPIVQSRKLRYSVRGLTPRSSAFFSTTSCYYFKEMLLPGNSREWERQRQIPQGKGVLENWIFSSQGPGLLR